MNFISSLDEMSPRMLNNLYEFTFVGLNREDVFRRFDGQERDSWKTSKVEEIGGVFISEITYKDDMTAWSMLGDDEEKLNSVLHIAETLLPACDNWGELFRQSALIASN